MVGEEAADGWSRGYSAGWGGVADCRPATILGCGQLYSNKFEFKSNPFKIHLI
jgi:hypothetical protein